MIELTHGEDFVVRLAINNLDSALRVTTGRVAERSPSDGRREVAVFLRQRANELDPPPSVDDPDLAFDATLAIVRAVASDDREAIFDALGLASIRDPDARLHARELLAGVLTDLAELLRVIPA